MRGPAPHGRCVRSGARIWWIPPPRCMRSEHWKEPSRLYSQDSQQVLIFFGVESGVAFNVLTTGLFRIQQSSHASAPTLCLRESRICEIDFVLKKISAENQSREGRKFPSSPATAKITKVGLQLHFGWAHAHPGNRLSNLKILARYL